MKVKFDTSAALAVVAGVAFAAVLVLTGVGIGGAIQEQSREADVARHETTVRNCNDMIDLMQIAANDFASGLTEQGHEVYQEVNNYRWQCR